MRRYVFWILAATALLPGCATKLSNQIVHLEYLPKSGVPKPARSEVLLELFVDARSDTARIGTLLNLALGNAETAQITTPDDISIWVTQGIKLALEYHGYRVETVDSRTRSGPDETLIRGEITQVFSEVDEGFHGATQKPV